MTSSDRFNAELGHRPHLGISPEGEDIAFLVLASIDEAISGHGLTAVHSSFRELLLLLGETHILSHPRISRLREIWPGILGEAEMRIERVLTVILGQTPSQALVRYVYRSLNGTAARRKRHAGEHEWAFSGVLDRLRATGSDLYCAVCGYRFRAKDIGPDRLISVVDKGFTLERNLFPGRANDPLKPLTRGRDNQSTTRLTLDHVVPEELFGWSEEDNLEIVCGFCNQGKSAYRRPLEALTTFATGALSEIPKSREFTVLKHQIVVAALRSHGGSCYKCRRTKDEIELTIRPVLRPNDSSLQGFSPWNLRSICYICLSDEREESAADDELIDQLAEAPTILQ